MVNKSENVEKFQEISKRQLLKKKFKKKAEKN